MRKTRHVIVNRAQEPSTHAGVAALAQAAKIFFPQYAAIADAASMIFGALAVVMPERLK